MASLYRVSFDYNLKQFDNLYPITLSPYGITPQEFYYTIGQCSLILSSAHDDLYRLHKRNFAYLAGCIIALFSLIIPPLFFVTSLEFWVIPTIVVLAIVLMGGGMVYLCIRWINMIKEIQSITKRRVVGFLNYENETRYRSRGVQFLIRMDANRFGESEIATASNTSGNHVQPVIEVLACYPHVLYLPNTYAHYFYNQHPGNAAHQDDSMSLNEDQQPLLAQQQLQQPHNRVPPPPPPHLVAAHHMHNSNNANSRTQLE